MEQASSTIRIYVEGPAEKVGISAFSQKGCGLVETTTNEGTFGSLVNVWTNGIRTNRFGVHAGSESEQYIVAENLPKGVTVIDIAKGTEAGFGLLVVEGVHLPEGASLAPLPETPRKVIEFIGDSDCTGAGAVGPSKCMNMEYILPRMSFFSDPAVSYARFVAKSFDADLVNLACGGIGFIANDAQNDKQVNLGGPAAPVYDHKLCFNWGEDPANGNVAKYTAEDIPKADLVVIWLGQNDIITGVIETGDIAKGVEKYTELLTKIRELRPQTPVLCLYHDSMMHASHPQSRDVLEGFGVPSGYGPTSAYARQKAIAGEESVIKEWATGAAKAIGGEINKIYVRPVSLHPFFDPTTDYGAGYEMGANAQMKFARGIVPQVQAITKWPVAADFKF